MMQVVSANTAEDATTTDVMERSDSEPDKQLNDFQVGEGDREDEEEVDVTSREKIDAKEEEKTDDTHVEEVFAVEKAGSQPSTSPKNTAGIHSSTTLESSSSEGESSSPKADERVATADNKPNARNVDPKADSDDPVQAKTEDLEVSQPTTMAPEPPHVDEEAKEQEQEPPRPSLPSEMEENVARYLYARTAKSPFFQAHPPASLPILDTDEITLGLVLGQGEFGRVKEVIEINDKAGHEGLSRLLRQSKHTSSHTGSCCRSHHNASGKTEMTCRSSTTRDPSSSRDAVGLVEEASDGEDSFCCEEGSSSNHVAAKEKADGEEASIEFVEMELAKKARKVLKKRCWREGKARYAVKQLREELLEPPEDGDEDWHMGTIGAMDLAMEAALLSSLSHPNIVKLRATAGIPGRPDYMLVMDRLYTTLDHQIDAWRLEQPHPSPIQQFLKLGGAWNIVKKLKPRRKLGSSSEKDFTRRKAPKPTSQSTNRLLRKGQLLHRLYAAYDVARALRYMHQHKIIFRDLKPQNIAYDIRGDVRIFDLGLAKELVASELVHLPDDYNATGMTGSRRWMSPEVYFSELYGLSADVYSFGLLLWNLCYLRTPFGECLSVRSHHDKVMVKGQRPKKLPSKIVPQALWSLMSMCWSTDREERPTMELVCQVLKDEITNVRMDIQLAVGGGKATPVPSGATTAPAAEALDGTAATQDLSGAFTSMVSSHRSMTSSHGSFRREVGFPKLFRRANANKLSIPETTAVDPVNMSCHHRNNNKAANRTMRGQPMPKQHSRFFPRLLLRNSDLEGRSEYLLEKSVQSLANLQISSAHLGSSAGSSRGSHHKKGSASPMSFKSHKSHRRALFGGGDSVWSVVTT